MKGTLLLAILTVKSSYAQETEQPLASLADVPDTLQWWIAETGVWRIRTYAMDHDIHTHLVGGNSDDSLGLARESNRRHFSDVIGAEHLVTFADCNDSAEARAKFEQIGLAPQLEVAAGRFAFWKPDNAKYSTKSAPR